MNDLTLFEDSWARAWKGVGARGDGRAVLDELLARYGEPHRKYHTTQHLLECLAGFNRICTLPPHPTEVEMALWFHDAIYDVNRHDNEAQSADWAYRALIDQRAPAAAAELVRSLVMVTRHAGLPATPDEQYLVDVDLSILGAVPARFAEYEMQIREEYAHVPDAIFRDKRREILRTFLDRSRIFTTAHFHQLLEDRARENLRIAIAATLRT